MKANVKIFWTKGGSAKLKKLPWEDMDVDGFSVTHQQLDEGEMPLNKLSQAAESSLVVYIGDYDEKKDIQILEKANIDELPENVIFFILVPSDLIEKIGNAVKGRSNLYPLQKPISSSLLLTVLEKTVLSEIYSRHIEKTEVSELEWLRRIEKIFDLSRNEQLQLEETNTAYEHLVDYGQELLREQRRINQALINLQEYRDKERVFLEQERAARDSLEELMRSEIKTRDDVLKAQEKLLRYSNLEKLALQKIMKDVEQGTIDQKVLSSFLERQDMLIKEVERLCSQEKKETAE